LKSRHKRSGKMMKTAKGKIRSRLCKVIQKIRSLLNDKEYEYQYIQNEIAGSNVEGKRD
jgi:hypothetical protein